MVFSEVLGYSEMLFWYMSGSERLLKFMKVLKRFLIVWDVLGCCVVFRGVLVVLSASEMYLKVLSSSLAFWGSVAFLGVVMGCMHCERSLNFLRHFPVFSVHLKGC